MVTNMRCLAVLILFAIHSCFCDHVRTLNLNKLSTSSQNRTNKMDVFNNTNCNKIKCSTKVERMCVKLINKKGYGSKNIYIMVINKCEIEYIKCHKGLEAKVVPMKNCLDKHAVKSRSLAQKKRIKRSPYVATKTHHNNHPGSSRNRRKFVSSSNKSQKKLNYPSLYFGAHNRRHSEVKNTEEEFKEGDSNVEQSQDEHYNAASNEDDNTQNNVIFQIRQIDNGDEPSHDGNFAVGPEYEAKSDNSKEISPTNNNESQENEQGGVSGNVDETQNVDADAQKSDNDASFINPDENEQVNDNNNSANRVDGQESNEQDKENVESEINDENDTEKKYTNSIEKILMENFESSQEENKEVSLTGSNKNNTMDGKKSNTANKTTNQAVPNYSDVVYYDVDMAQYNKDCPSVCPVRDVMVCGRYMSNGPREFYRSFLSVCHLRMWNCKFSDWKFELISWQPCSLIIISQSRDLKFPTKGRVREPNDEDVVLNHIRCKETEKFGCNTEK